MAIAIVRKPIVRMVSGGLMVRIEEDGVSIKGYRKRRWLKVGWKKLARLAAQETLPEDKRMWTEEEWGDILGTIGAK